MTESRNENDLVLSVRTANVMLDVGATTVRELVRFTDEELLETRCFGETTLKEVKEALGKSADQALRAGDIIRRLRDFVARGESERRIESVAKIAEEASALALVGAKDQGVRT